MLTELLLQAYALTNRTGFLKKPRVKREFAKVYFLYKRLVEDPYHNLVRAHPELFRGRHVIDVGANIGYTATLFAQAADRQARVYAFEPDPDNFDLLTKVVDSRGFRDRVFPICAAVGEREGKVELWRNPISHADHRIWTPRFRSTTPEAGQSVITVPMIMLDSFLAHNQLRMLPCFVKIDVQGYELPVCSGMRGTLESNPDLIVSFEYTPEAMQTLGFEPAELLDLFHSKGFSIYIIQENGQLRPLTGTIANVRDINRHGYAELLAMRKTHPKSC